MRIMNLYVCISEMIWLDSVVSALKPLKQRKAAAGVLAAKQSQIKIWFISGQTARMCSGASGARSAEDRLGQVNNSQ